MTRRRVRCAGSTRRAPASSASSRALIAFEAAQDPGGRRGGRGHRRRRARARRRGAARIHGAVRPRARRHRSRRSRFRRPRCARPSTRCRRRSASALETAAARIRAYHERQKMASWSYREADGSELGQQVTPLDRVGVYVPGRQGRVSVVGADERDPGARRRRGRDRHGRADARRRAQSAGARRRASRRRHRARSRSAARRRSPRSPTAPRRFRRSTRSAAPATPTSPRPSGACSAPSASTWSPASRRSW